MRHSFEYAHPEEPRARTACGWRCTVRRSSGATARCCGDSARRDASRPHLGGGL